MGAITSWAICLTYAAAAYGSLPVPLHGVTGIGIAIGTGTIIGI